MTAAIKNFQIEQKATFSQRLIYRDKMKKAINLTGFQAHMQIRSADGAVISDLSTQNGKIVLGGVAGTIDLNIPVSETTAMNFTSALYDLKLIASDGTHMRLLQGKVTLSPGQTT